MSRESEERDWLLGEIADSSQAFTPTTVERVKATKSFVGQQVGPTTPLVSQDAVPLFTPILSMAQQRAMRISPTISSPRVVGTTFRINPNTPIPEWDMSQHQEGIRIPGQVSGSADFMKQAETALHKYHTDVIENLISRRVHPDKVRITRERFDRNMIRLQQGHLPTIANALGLMGHSVAVDSKQAGLAITQFHPIETLRWRNAQTEQWGEQPVPNGQNRAIGAYSDKDGGGFILPNDRRPRRTQGQ